MFVADVMLAKVARWLRILGIRVESPELKDDGEFIKYAKENKLILLTMDVELSKRARKQNVGIFLVPKKNLEEQLASILKEFSIPLGKFPSETICPKCNGELKTAEKKDVEGRVYKKTFEEVDSFWECRNCKHVFWEGSHTERIRNAVRRIGDLMK